MGTWYAGLDVSDKATSICVLDSSGAVALETSVDTNAAAIALALKPYRRLIDKIGHESGSKATWLHKELLRKKLPVLCLDARHTHAALAANRNKTDKNDARGIAQVLARGIYTEAYVRSDTSQRTRDLLSHRLALVRRGGDLKLLQKASLKLAGVTMKKLPGGGVELKAAPRRGVDPTFTRTMEATSRAIEALEREAACLSIIIEGIAREDAICMRLMTMPGVGPITSVSYKAAVDDPARFKSSRNLAAYFGLTPRTFQSGESRITGHISKRGDSEVRALLYLSAASVINITKRQSRIRTWALRLRKEKGFKVAAVACARRMCVVLHRMWLSGEDFDPAR